MNDDTVAILENWLVTCLIYIVSCLDKYNTLKGTLKVKSAVILYPYMYNDGLGVCRIKYPT